MNGLLRITGSLAFLAAVFLNAFVDLGHKIIIQNTIFKVYDGQTQIILTAIVNGLILLPFILLLSPSGFIADKHPKNRVMKQAAWVALALTLAITYCYYQGWFWPAFAMTFLLAVQSAFYSPAKYGYIKPLFSQERLAQANGLVQATTIVSILAGTLAYSVLFEILYPEGITDSAQILASIAPLGWLLVVNAAIALAALYRLPTLETGAPQQPFPLADYLSGQLIKNNLAGVRSQRVILFSILGLATFWSAGQVMLAAFPAYAKQHFGLSNTAVVQGILASTGVGIMVGSWLAGRISRHHIETGLIPVGALAIVTGLWLLPTLSTPAMQAGLFALIGVAGGLFIVPLNALIQFHAGEHQMGRVLAVNNWIQNIAMLSCLILTALFALQGFDSKSLLQLTALAALAGCGFCLFRLPQSLVRLVINKGRKSWHRLRVEGLNHLPSQGPVLLISQQPLSDHWPLIQAACPRSLAFPDNRANPAHALSRWLLEHLKAQPASRTAASPDALSSLLGPNRAACILCPDQIPASWLSSADAELLQLVPVQIASVSDGATRVRFGPAKRLAEISSEPGTQAFFSQPFNQADDIQDNCADNPATGL